MSNESICDNSAVLTEEEVSRFLRENPDFFVKHPGLLTELSLPHDSRGAISLVERQVSVLRERNMDMRHRMSKLLDNARDNDRLFEKTKRLTLTLLECHDLGDIVDALFYSFDNDFNIHYTSLIFFGNAQSISSTGSACVASLTDARKHIGSLLKTNRAICGSLGRQEAQFLFGDKAEYIGSAALVPLLNSNIYGVLSIANRDPQYYRSSMGTLFLNYIADILNRILPRYLPR
ncbi:MAG: DUF484 family protein [Exilibacterium sp.]